MKKVQLLILVICVLLLSGCNSPAEYELLDTCERVPYNDVWNQKGIFKFQFLDIKEIPLTTLEETNQTLTDYTISKDDYQKIVENHERLFEYTYSLDYTLEEDYDGPDNSESILYYNISCCTADTEGKAYAMVDGVGGLTGIENGNLMHPGDSCIKTFLITCKDTEELNDGKQVENLRFNVYIYRDSYYQYRREFMYTIP